MTLIEAIKSEPIDYYNCPKCGGRFPVDVPFISKDYVGRQSAVHEPCGKGFTSCTFWARSEAKQKLWAKIMEAL